MTDVKTRNFELSQAEVCYHIALQHLVCWSVEESVARITLVTLQQARFACARLTD